MTRKRAQYEWRLRNLLRRYARWTAATKGPHAFPLWSQRKWEPDGRAENARKSARALNRARRVRNHV